MFAEWAVMRDGVRHIGSASGLGKTVYYTSWQRSVIHCRCSRCFLVPSKRRLRKRPRVLTLLCLPEDVLFHVLKGLPAEDLLSLRVVHPHLKYLVDNHASVWACASFQEVWPSPSNLNMFERAAEKGNFEAAVKLGIAYLYNEGLSVADEGRAEVNGLKASHFFSLTEHLNTSAAPFVWLFIRPPWSLSGSCCKAVVYESLKAECQQQKSQRGSILYCLAKVLNLFEDEEKRKEALEMFEISSRQGCLHSAYLLWENNRKAAMLDPGRYLQSLRKLRDYAAKGSWEAQIALAKACGNGNQLGLETKASNEMVSQLFQTSVPLNKQSIFTVQKGMNETMRYILIDWLVEVATMKDFSSLCLHMTVGCVDRYLKIRPVPRARLQLLGIACMVICTRFISKEILTIREAVWLTDNTYKYEDLVRMMGEIISALEGKIRIPTIIDYKEVLLNIIPLERRTVYLYSFICELSLLNTGLCIYSPARLAAAALLLAKVLYKQAHPWTSQLSESTGFSLEELTPCVLSLHKKCFHEDVPKDYRQVSLTAVKQRFEDERYEEISKEEAPIILVCWGVGGRDGVIAGTLGEEETGANGMLGEGEMGMISAISPPPHTISAISPLGWGGEDGRDCAGWGDGMAKIVRAASDHTRLSCTKATAVVAISPMRSL
ncbi:Cyclin-F [Varanus komodoensis]|nr:Cyclin-F [Varanus komodoensis]